MVNATTERVPQDPSTTSQVRDQYASLEVILEEAFEMAVRQGEVPHNSDTRRHAPLVMATVQGLRVLAPATDPAVLADVAAATMAALKSTPTGRGHAASHAADREEADVAATATIA